MHAFVLVCACVTQCHKLMELAGRNQLLTSLDFPTRPGWWESGSSSTCVWTSACVCLCLCVRVCELVFVLAEVCVYAHFSAHVHDSCRCARRLFACVCVCACVRGWAQSPEGLSQEKLVDFWMADRLSGLHVFSLQPPEARKWQKTKRWPKKKTGLLILRRRKFFLLQSTRQNWHTCASQTLPKTERRHK